MTWSSAPGVMGRLARLPWPSAPGGARAAGRGLSRQAAHPRGDRPQPRAQASPLRVRPAEQRGLLVRAARGSREVGASALEPVSIALEGGRFVLAGEEGAQPGRRDDDEQAGQHAGHHNARALAYGPHQTSCSATASPSCLTGTRVGRSSASRL